MFIYLLSHLLSAWFAFLLPSFYTFKALSHGPVPGAELERWAKYWTVIGAFVTLEYVAERVICWLPFYWEIKTLFLLYISIPQTEGSTYIYNAYLQPFFVKNEAELDAGIISIQKNLFVFVQSRLSSVLEFIIRALNKISASRQTGGSGQAPEFSLDAVMGLWRSYGSAVIAGVQKQAQTFSGVPPTAATTSYQATTESNGAQRTPKQEIPDPVLQKDE